MKYEFARNEDLPAIIDLLDLCGLPSNDLEMHLDHFLVAKEKAQLVGCVGMEVAGPLLRSLAVRPEYRNRGIAKELCDRLIQHAAKQGGKEIFLLTETASRFFDKAGFQRKDREEAPDWIRNHKQFTELCPSSAVLMWRAL